MADFIWNTLFFEYCENVHMRPDWWEGLKDGCRLALVQREVFVLPDPAHRGYRDVVAMIPAALPRIGDQPAQTIANAVNQTR